jgi:hypothetical protein
MRLAHALVIALALFPAAALAQPGPPPQPPPSWDSRGWVMLGERMVHGHGQMEHDRIDVGRFEGRFDKLTIVVERADLEMVDFVVTFGKGDPWHPEVKHFFREGQRTRVIEFPPSAWGNVERSIKSIDFMYRNVPGERHAVVQVWGWKTGNAPPVVVVQPTPPPPPPPAQLWDSRGWVMLGDREVHGHGKLERDQISVGRFEGRFSKLTVVVENSDLEMVDMTVVFGRGDPWRPGVSHFFREGQRTRVIEFPETAWGNTQRTIQSINFTYRNIPGEGHARVQVWGWKTGNAPPVVVEGPPPPPAPVWESRGWVMLGERMVHGHGQMERDKIAVGRQEGRFSKLTLVVENSDLELVDMTVVFGKGDPWKPPVSHFFREGQRTRVIEFPENVWGNTQRSIKEIWFTYRNVPGEGHARVQIWAQ